MIAKLAVHGVAVGLLTILTTTPGMTVPLCAAGDLAGAWKFYGMAANASNDVDPTDFTNTGSVIWCSINLANASSSPIKYNISGTCHSRGVTQANSTFTVKAGSSLTETTACALSGTMKIVNSPFVMTLLDAKIDSSSGRKTRATGVAETPNTTRRINYTFFNMQR
jgi:hypothetical protein